MDTNSKNSRTSEYHLFVLKLLDKLDLKRTSAPKWSDE